MYKKIASTSVAMAMMLGAFLAPAMAADPYPSRPIRIVVPFGAGTGSDLVTRIFSEAMGRQNGAVFVIENAPGGNGVIGANKMLAAPADGYALMTTGPTTHSLGSIYSNQTYHPLKDFYHIGLTNLNPFMIVVSPTAGIKSIADLIAKSKQRPLFWASASSSSGINGASFNKAAQLNATEVPFKTAPQALVEVANGRVDFMASDVGSARGLVDGGRLQALVMLGTIKTNLYPNIPTMPEVGYQAIPIYGWIGIAGAAGIPAEAKDWLKKNMAIVVKNPDYIAKVAQLGALVPQVANIEEFVTQQVDSWTKFAKEAGIKPE